VKSSALGVCAIAAVAMFASGIAQSANPGARESRTMQIVFADGASLRLDPRHLAELGEFSDAADGTNGGPVVTDGIVRLQSGRLRQSPVLLSGNGATADASLAVRAALRGDRAAARAALRRAKAGSDGAAPGRGQGWVSVARAHVLLAEAQVLDLDDRHRDAEAAYLQGLEAIAADGTQSGFADVRVMLAADLTRGLAENLAAQGRQAEAQAAARRSVRTYAARFGRAPAFAGGRGNGVVDGGFTQVAVNRVPGGAVVSHMLLSGVLFVTAIGDQDSDDNEREPSGEAGGRSRSDEASDGDNVREPSGEAGGRPRSTDGPDRDNTREASGKAGGGPSRSTDGSDRDNSREASGRAGGTSRSADGSGRDNTREASGKAGGTSRSTDGSGRDNSREASGKAGGTPRS